MKNDPLIRSLKKIVSVPTFLLVMTFLVYSPALWHDFVNLDDSRHVTQNTHIRSLAPQNINKIFTSSVQRTYIPLTILSFAVEYHFAGLHPMIYHLNNILLHMLVVFLIFRIGIALHLSTTAAGIAAFLFALHPMHVESVAWVTERKDVLYSACYLSAVLCYLNFLKTKKTASYGLSLLLAFFSILAKPMALSLPLILLLCDWFQTGAHTKKHLLTKIPYVILLLPVTWVTYSINTGIVGQTAGPGLLHPFWAAAFYLKKFFWPTIMIPHYLPPLPISFSNFEYLSSVLIIIACGGAFFVWPNRWYRFALLWYFFSIFFLLNFNPERVVQVVADRYMYLPSAGFCFLLGYVVERINTNQLWSSPKSKTAFFITLSGMALFLSIRTFTQVGIWHNSLTLWNYTIHHSPSSYLAFNNRGRIYESQRKWELAKADYQNAIRLNPKYEKPYKNLAMVYEQLGDKDTAIEYYSKAIAAKPNYSAAYNNRALLFEQKGKRDLALEDYNRAILANPTYALGYKNRAAFWIRSGEIQKSIDDLTNVIALNPGDWKAYRNRAICYHQIHLFILAQQDCQKAVQINTTDPNTRVICKAINQEIHRLTNP